MNAPARRLAQVAPSGAASIADPGRIPGNLPERLERLGQELLEAAEILRSVLPNLPEPGLHGVQRRRSKRAAATSNDAMLTTSDVCRILGCDVRTLRRWRHEKQVPRPVQIGGRLRWRRRDLLPWIEKRRAC